MPYKDEEKQREKAAEYSLAYYHRQKSRRDTDASRFVCTRCHINRTDGVRKRCLECLTYMRTYKAEHGRHPDTSPGKCTYSDCSSDATPGYKSCASCRTKARKWSPLQQAKKEAKRKKRQALKLEVFNAYGGPKCICCGEAFCEFLSIDHMDGGGSEHRKQLTGNGRDGSNLYQWLKKNNFPSGFRVLCMNCNFALGHFGYCPHGLVVDSKAS